MKVKRKGVGRNRERLSIWMELPVSEMAADRVFESESVS